ncbi:methionine sulfoxide reductase [Planomicrobium sp. CPCC 101079]|uniref:methionine sulfoxide reductase n=1 Tax=Planomicrobium sp. CPCC 101079 TaxID=2599618 RepID=UPI0011B448C2|nr:methionine sulfoxide reductase [Planomicrobium sp. CPCC 101079]TWT01869.1 methionine sulfoxide reductase [Planomicrobium sp. CPCC 101079]
MEKEIYIKKVAHDTQGELYQFLYLNPETGQEEAVDPFETGLFQEVTAPEPELLEIRSKRGADAKGYYRGEKFVVMRASKFAASTSPKCPKRYVKLREHLLLEGLLVPLGAQLLVMQDIEFESPMAAMGSAIGGWVRGPHDWKEVKKK